MEDDDDYTAPCPHCREPIPEDAPRCPYCENYTTEDDAPARNRKPLWIWIGLIVALILALYMAFA